MLKKFPELKALCKLHLTHLHLPDAVIFLDVDPAVCIERITARGEKVQAHENIEKLTKLRDAYRLVCNVVKQTRPLLHLTGKKSLEELTEEATAFIRSASN